MNELGCSNSWLGVLWFHIYYALEHHLFISFFFCIGTFSVTKADQFHIGQGLEHPSSVNSFFCMAPGQTCSMPWAFYGAFYV